MIHTKCLYCKSTLWDPIHHAMVAMGNIIQHFRMHKTHVPEAKSVLWSRVPIAMGKVRYQSGDHTQHAKVLLQSPFWALVRGPKVNCEYISGRIAFSKFTSSIGWAKLITYYFLYLVPTCTCKDFTRGDVSCSKVSKFHGGKKACYVNYPSSCNDLIWSIYDQGEKLSAEACSAEGILFWLSDILLFFTINQSYSLKKLILMFQSPATQYQSNI